ncbi:MAG: TIM barrel protein [Phycisphaerae bacterium]|nr:TIM barrel protein [Phycisphaerae bacterium]
MDRRAFLASGLAVGAAMGSGSVFAQEPKSNRAKFKLRYAPNMNAFKGHAGDNTVDQIKFLADEGFTAAFDLGIGRKPADEQAQIIAEMDKHEMLLGPISVPGGLGIKTMVETNKDIRETLKSKMKDAVEAAKRIRAKWLLVVPGNYSQGVEWDYQTANVIDNLRACCEVLEPAGVVMVLEPLNWYANHPGLFLTKIPQAYMICRGVNSPSCKIVNDLYHQQITEGNLIPNIDKAWSEIGSFHVGDNPGRKEPGTGEINYKNVFQHIYKKGYQGALCCEHGFSKPGKEGERAMIEAYRVVDNFEV